jgi:hypothetical protein
MANSTIKLASYSIAIGRTGTQLAILLEAADPHDNLPEELRLIRADILPGRTLDWQLNGELTAIQVYVGNVFSDPQIHGDVISALGRTLPKMTSYEDVVQTATNAIEAQISRWYPGAAVTFEDDCIVVHSNTSIPSRTPGAAKKGQTGGSGKRGPKRAEGRLSQINRWL